jgi:hypothetical protein
VVSVSRTGGASGAASIDYSINNGSALAGADFAPASGTLQWASGQSGERTFSVALVNDTAVESAESATLVLSNAIGAALGTRASAALTIADDDTTEPGGGSGGTPDLADTFSRTDGGTIGNGWIEKNAAAFSLQSGRAAKQSTSADYRNNLVYRPAIEDLADVEVAAEFRLNSGTVGYPMVVARLQNASTADGFTGYLLAIAGTSTGATISRQNGGGWDSILTGMTLSSALNTFDTYRLRLRISGSTAVALAGYVERWTGSAWQTIGSATLTDTSSSRIVGSGSVGFGGDVESSYSFDNVSRSALTP